MLFEFVMHHLTCLSLLFHFSALVKCQFLNHFTDYLTSGRPHLSSREEGVSILPSNSRKAKRISGGSPTASDTSAAGLSESAVARDLPTSGFSTVSRSTIWKDNGVAECWYFFDADTHGDRTMFEAALKTWSDKTCVRFHKLPPGPCNQSLAHGSICVGDFGTCWSMVGNHYRPGEPPQKMSVPLRGCDVVAAAHELGHALGSRHQQSRPDRDRFLTVNFENFRLSMDYEGEARDLLTTWEQGERCGKGQLSRAPVPYDFMSLMQYMSADFADLDRRPTFVTVDARHQYMLDYHRRSGAVQSHFDLYSLNTVYGCDEVWAKSCVGNEKHPPKCKNLGYLGADCKCKCPKAFTGAACETKVGPLFPVLAKAKVMLDVRKDDDIDLSTKEFLSEKLDATNDEFKYHQFFTLIADGPDAKTQVSINVKQSVGKCPLILMPKHSDVILKSINSMDCYHGVSLMWGLSKRGQLRTECLSSVANNEADGPMFRSKTNHLDLIYHSSVGIGLRKPVVTVQLMRLRLRVRFAPRPDKVLRVKRGTLDAGDGVLGNGSDAQASRMPGPGVWAGVGVGMALVAALLVALAAALYVGLRRRAARATEPDALLDRVDELLGPGSSDSDGSDDSDDGGDSDDGDGGASTESDGSDASTPGDGVGSVPLAS